MKIKKLKLKKNSNNEYSDYYFIPKNENVKCADGNSLESIIYDLKSKIDTLTNKTNDLIKNAPLIGVAEGTNLDIKDSAESNIKKLGIYGNDEQKQYEGKNLFKPIASNTKVGIDFINNGDGSYTLNGTAASTTSFYVDGLNYEIGEYTLNANNPIAISNSAFYIQMEYNGGSIRKIFTEKNATITKNVTATITALSIVVPSGLTLSNFIIRPQLEKGSISTSFEPYTGGQPSPNPEYPQEIEVIDNHDTENKYNLPEGHIGLRQTNEDGSREKIYAINLAGNSIAKVGNVKDLLSISNKGVVELEKKINKVILDGSENWNLISNNRFECALPKKAGDGYWTVIAKTNQFVGIAQKDIDSTTNINVFAVSIDNINIKPSNDINTIDLFKSKLLQNPLTVYYQLATSQKLTLPTTEPIEMWEGINMFELIGNLEPSNMKIVYKKDINSIIKESGV